MSNKNHESLIELQETLRHSIEHKEARFNYWLSLTSMIGLVIIPLIPASLTYMSIATQFPSLLHIPVWMAHIVGFLSAVGVELLGLLTIRTALRMGKYNQKAEKAGLPKAPMTQGYLAAGVYVLIVLSLVVLLKIFPSLILWALIPMSLMALVAEWGFLLSVDQSERDLEARLHQNGESAEGLHEQLNERDQIIDQLNTTVHDLAVNMRSIMDTVHAMNAANASIADLVSTVQANMIERMNAVSMTNEQRTSEILASMGSISQEVERLHDAVHALPAPVVNPDAVQSQPKRTKRTAYSVQPVSDEHVQAEGVHVQPVSNEHVQAEDKQPTVYTDKAERQSALIRHIAINLNGQPADALNKSELGKMFGASRVTIGRDIDELIDANRLAVNGVVKVL